MKATTILISRLKHADKNTHNKSNFNPLAVGTLCGRLPDNNEEPYYVIDSWS